jgi:hypothetical protein
MVCIQVPHTEIRRVIQNQRKSRWRRERKATGQRVGGGR